MDAAELTVRKIDRELLPDEQVLFRTGKHYIVFLHAVIWAIVTGIFLLTPNPLIMKFALVPALATVVTAINQWFVYYFADFVVTNRRLLMKEGFFFRHTWKYDSQRYQT